MAYLKPQTPIQLNDNYIYPLTTADQVMLGNGNRLNTLFKKTIKETATLQVANWSDTLPYIQTITISESTDDYNVDANIVYNGNEADTELNKAAGCISYIKKNHKEITFYCLKEKPMINIPVEITGTCRNTIATVEEGIKLNFDIIGNPRPKTGDTLYWDGNTEGLEVYDLGGGYTYYKVSDVVPTLDDFSKGAYSYFTRLGYEHYIQPIAISYYNNDIWVSDAAIIVDNENASVSKGTYFLAYDSYYLSYLTIPGFTGFEKDDIEVKENTIWVDTDVPITGYKFSATEPEEPVDGMVWIKTGKNSDGVFNIVDDVIIHPISAKQYILETWVDVEAKNYKNDEWVEWIVSLYNAGNEYIDVTGGWVCKSFLIDKATNYTPVTKTLTKNDDHILLSSSFGDNTSTIICHEKPIDLTEWSTVTIEFEVTRTAVKNAARLQICDTALSGSSYAAVMLFDSGGVYGDGKASVDISNLSGEYIIGIPIWAPDPATIDFKLKSLIME